GGLAAAAPDLEVQARAGDVGGGAALGDDLALLHHVVLLHQQRLVVAVGSDVARAVADQQQVAELGDVAAGIKHSARVGGLDRRSLLDRDVDAVVLLTARAGAVACQNLAVHGPDEARRGAGRRLGRGGGAERRRLAGGG